MSNLREIQSLQDEFAEASQVACMITHPDGTLITKPSNSTSFCRKIIMGSEKDCASCIKANVASGLPDADAPLINRCQSSGLLSSGVPMFLGDQHIANWVICQVRSNDMRDSEVMAYARETSMDEGDVLKAFHELPLLSEAEFTKSAQFLNIYVKQISQSAYENLRQACEIGEIESSNQIIDKNELAALCLQKDRHVCKMLFNLLDTLPFYVFLQSPDYTYRYTNKKFKNLFGDTPVKFCLRNTALQNCKTTTVLKTGNHQEWEWEVAPHGRTYQVYDYPFIDADGSTMVLELGVDITERKKREKDVKGTLKKNELLFKEMHHRVKNNLQAISSMLALQAQASKDTGANLALMDCERRIAVISDMHDILCGSDGLSKNISIRDFLKTIIRSVRSGLINHDNEIVISHNIDEVLIDTNVAPIIGEIVSELLANSIKYAFGDKDTGMIKVSFYKQDDEYFKLSVSDDGVGLPRDFDIMASTTLGLQLVVHLVTMLKGQIAISKPPGTQFEIYFKL